MTTGTATGASCNSEWSSHKSTVNARCSSMFRNRRETDGKQCCLDIRLALELLSVGGSGPWCDGQVLNSQTNEESVTTPHTKRKEAPENSCIHFLCFTKTNQNHLQKDITFSFATLGAADRVRRVTLAIQESRIVLPTCWSAPRGKEPRQ